MFCLAALRRNCKDGEWLCNDRRRCIQEKYVCDGKIHCGDGSDNSSALCETWQCPEGMWKCLNDKCIEEKEVCDGTEQLLFWEANFKSKCGDGSDLTDELCSKWSCSDTTWKCKSDNLCIPRFEVCNGEKGCSDGADENDDLCLKWNCSERYWKCQENRRCISRVICFKCSKGTYIPMSLINNGIADCPLFDDEALYSKKNISRNTMNPTMPPAERCIYDRFNGAEDISHCLFYECPYHFKCSNSYCIPHKHVCDNVYDCPDGIDEELSMCRNLICYHKFKCVYGAHCLHHRKVCDGYKDCSDDTYLGEDESLCGADLCLPGCSCHGHAYIHSLSKPVPPMPDTEHCIHDRNLHLKVLFCMFYQCPFHFKCKNTYCIPHKYVCDKTLDCPNGGDEHESLCLNHTCHGQFKCVYGNHCLHYDKICDGFKDCHDATYAGEDESVCDVGRCPFGCYCLGHAYACVNITWKNIPIQDTGAHVILIYKMLVLTDRWTFKPFSYLFCLSVTQTEIKAIPSFVFEAQKYLIELDLKNNEVERIVSNTFIGLKQIKIIILSSNKIQQIDKNSFLHILELQYLDLSNNFLSYLNFDIVCQEIGKCYLNLRNNPLQKSTFDQILSLASVTVLLFSDVKYCCLKSHDSNVRCHASQNHTLDANRTTEGKCGTLFHYRSTPIILWIAANWISVISIFVVLIQTISRTFDLTALLRQSMCISDSLFAAYLFFVLQANIEHGVNYPLHPTSWHSSPTCRISGYFGTMSLLLSYTLFLIAAINFLHVTQMSGLSSHKQNTKHIVFLLTIPLIINSLVVLLPAIFLTSLSKLCLFIIIHEQTIDHKLTTIVFLVLIFIIWILLCFITYRAILEMNTKRTEAGRDLHGYEKSLIVREILIVISTIQPWLTMTCLLAMEYFCQCLSEHVMEWVVGVVLPSQPCINPFLFTFTSSSFYKQLKR